jgi:hypothetical protein
MADMTAVLDRRALTARVTDASKARGAAELKGAWAYKGIIEGCLDIRGYYRRVLGHIQGYYRRALGHIRVAV